MSPRTVKTLLRHHAVDRDWSSVVLRPPPPVTGVPRRGALPSLGSLSRSGRRAGAALLLLLILLVVAVNERKRTRLTDVKKKEKKKCTVGIVIGQFPTIVSTFIHDLNISFIDTHPIAAYDPTPKRLDIFPPNWGMDAQKV